MLSTADKKLIRKLRQKKYRWQNGLFVAEGPKVVNDLLQASLPVSKIFATDETQWPQAQSVSAKELKEISELSTPNQVLAIFEFPKGGFNANEACLLLDGINDPGNLGTIIRTADWFGFRQIFCLPGTADAFNPKTVQSTMGSLARVYLQYAAAESVLEQIEGHRLLVADMEGQKLEKVQKSTQPTALVMGSESHGPSNFWKERGEAVTISKSGGSEIDSLNVAVAAGIFMSQLS